ncbi:MAG: acetoacetate metabolism regulatory protein AtoC [Thermodesulfobacteriota bacterium]|nr:MAG: acetoacetate metabolism regulatory protein AtoC [Thermodesulfobacteriota bacterium]
MKNKTILLIDDDKSFRRVIEYQLVEEGYEVITADNGSIGLDILSNQKIDLVITDIRMPEMDGLELLKKLKEISYDGIVIVVTAYGSIESAVEAMRLGANDYITKPVDKNELLLKVEKALKYKDLLIENKTLREFLSGSFNFDNMIGKSSALKEVYEIVSQVANIDSSILIQGESGTGKEVLAKAIHFNSLRNTKPFVVVNCGAIPENLLESELFGYKRGSFTDARTDKAGKFEAAEGGTIFLDEISELPLKLQVKILRTLQDKEIDKIGELKPRKVDVRIIAATNQDLKKLVYEKQFRDDLFYRLSVIPISLPPLRERQGDIPLLAVNFLDKFAKLFGKNGINYDDEVIKVFCKYHWPGNIRELENLIHRLVVLCQGEIISKNDLPKELLEGKISEALDYILPIPESGIDLKNLERELIVQALIKKNWNQTQAAKLLNISRNSLIYSMQKYGIKHQVPSDKN